MSSFDFILVFVLLFLSFFLTTQLPQKEINKNYWKFMGLPIIIYSFAFGFRYGWGLDYLSYKYFFEHACIPFQITDRFWVFFNQFISKIGIGYIGFFTILAMAFILSGCLFIKSYKENKYMPFLFSALTMYLVFAAVRQGFAHVFVFLSLYFLNKEQLGRAALMIPIIYGIHPSALFTLTVCILCYFVFSKPFPYKIVLPAFLIISVFSYSLAETLTNYLPMMMQYIPNIGERYEGYIEQSEQWFGLEAIAKERHQRLVSFLMMTAYHAGIIYLCGLSLKYSRNKNVAYIYNANIIGIVLFRIFIVFEILKRIAVPLEALSFVTLGYSLYFFNSKRLYLSVNERKYSKWAFAAIMLFIITYYGRFIFMSNGYSFVWNKIV